MFIQLNFFSTILSIRSTLYKVYARLFVSVNNQGLVYGESAVKRMIGFTGSGSHRGARRGTEAGIDISSMR